MITFIPLRRRVEGAGLVVAAASRGGPPRFTELTHMIPGQGELELASGPQAQGTSRHEYHDIISFHVYSDQAGNFNLLSKCK